MKAYHVTRESDLPSIMRDGLVPNIGPRSAEIGERRQAVFLFRSLEDMDNALYNWLGERFEGEERNEGQPVKHVALEVEIEDSCDTGFYEIEYPDTIPPANIWVLDYQVD